MKTVSTPRFAIIDTVDAPTKHNIAEWREGIGYCYMSRGGIPERWNCESFTLPLVRIRKASKAARLRKGGGA